MTVCGYSKYNADVNSLRRTSYAYLLSDFKISNVII